MKILKKNAISGVETKEFGQKMMNLLQSPICWPISNWKVAPIWANLNFGAKKKHEHRNKNFKKYYFGVQNDGIWQINDDSMKYVDLFQLKSWTNLSESEFWSQKTKEHRHESLKKKYHFGGQNDGIWPKNDDSMKKSFSLTYF